MNTQFLTVRHSVLGSDKLHQEVAAFPEPEVAPLSFEVGSSEITSTLLRAFRSGRSSGFDGTMYPLTCTKCPLRTLLLSGTMESSRSRRKTHQSRLEVRTRALLAATQAEGLEWTRSRPHDHGTAVDATTFRLALPDHVIAVSA